MDAGWFALPAKEATAFDHHPGECPQRTVCFHAPRPPQVAPVHRALGPE